MFGFVYCNASILARQNTDPNLFFVRTLVKNWLWPIITFFGVTGNILAIIVLTKRRMIMSSTNNYLVALALFDSTYLVLTLILNTLQNPCFTNTSLSEIVLTICRPIADFSSNTSVWLTVTFTVERWVAITYPLQSRTWCTVYRARKIILSVICASLLCTLPSAFEMKLVRIIEKKNFSNESSFTSYIKAKPTVLGNSSLYHQIYFNFVTFAIVWIPLLLLLIFNTILISYVRRSKQNKQQNEGGIELRRHNRSNQSEQRKTTIMLIAVVIVFTVCQIPQAISLTLQSFFPKLTQTSKVLIYNNFANCLVALNASINFFLYCCFSDRFRSTFRSNFTFLSKYCAHYIQPKWNMKSSQYPTLIDVSCAEHSNYSLHGAQLPTRISNISMDFSPKYIHYLNQKFEGNRSSLTPLKFKSPNQRKLTNPSILVRQSPTTLNVSTGAVDRTLKLSNNELESKDLPMTEKTSVTPSKHHSLSLNGLNRPILKSQFHPKSYSYRSLIDDNKDRQSIWVKRHQSNSTIEELLNRKNSFSWREIVDVAV